MFEAMRELTATDVMQTPVVTVFPDTPLVFALQRITEYGITSLPVVDDSRHCIGILSVTDLREFANRREPNSRHWRLRGRNLASATVADVMTRRVVGVRPGTTLRAVAQTMRQLALKHVPVLGASREIRGIISTSDYEPDPADHDLAAST